MSVFDAPPVMGTKILPRTANHQLLQQTHALAHTNALSLSLSLSLSHTHTHTHTHTVHQQPGLGGDSASDAECFSESAHLWIPEHEDETAVVLDVVVGERA